MSCNKKSRVTGPSGNWEYFNLIGAKVRVNSLPISNFFTPTGSGDDMTIKDIYFRISLDGKAITVIELEEWPGKFVTWKDIEVIEVSTSSTPAVCGEICVGITTCGYKVSSELSYLEDLTGLSIIDDNGNIINNRMVRFVGASVVEDIETDKDFITDITFGGSNILN